MPRNARRTWVCLVSLFITATVFAQNNRSAVSVMGSDGNMCTTVSPCRSFGVAMTHTNAGGEIIALDTAGYGPFTVDKAVTVSGAPGVHAALTVTTGNGISIAAAASDRVVLRNLVLIGRGGDGGISETSARDVEIIGCTILGFSGTQIAVISGNLTVDHLVAMDGNGPFTAGISVINVTMGKTTATIANSLIKGHFLGIVVGQRSALVVANSMIIGNDVGAEITSAGGTGALAADLTLENCTIAHNNTGVESSASGNGVANVYLQQNVIAYNDTGVLLNGGAVYSFRNNAFVGNLSDGGPLTPAGLQ